MRGKITLTAFVVFGFVLAGCHTVAGLGKDVSRAGNAITRAAGKSSSGAGRQSVPSVRSGTERSDISL